VENFLLAIGVKAVPRIEPFRYGSEYLRFVQTVIERIEYPRNIRGIICHDAKDLQSWRTDIDGLRLPDRWFKLLTAGDIAALSGFLLSSGAAYLADEQDSNAMFQA
jgi:hypothetical protein